VILVFSYRGGRFRQRIQLTMQSTIDPDLAKGFALYRGAPVAQLDGTEFVIDGSGWLRTMWYPRRQPDWSEPAVLRNELDRIVQHPIPGSPAAGHAHKRTEADGPGRHYPRTRPVLIPSSSARQVVDAAGRSADFSS
jgi:hypothetical protein